MFTACCRSAKYPRVTLPYLPSPARCSRQKSTIPPPPLLTASPPPFPVRHAKQSKEETFEMSANIGKKLLESNGELQEQIAKISAEYPAEIEVPSRGVFYPSSACLEPNP